MILSILLYQYCKNILVIQLNFNELNELENFEDDMAIESLIFL